MILIPGPRSASFKKRVNTGRMADSVFPLAVGDIRRTFLPSRIGGMALSWASVGLRNPRSLTASARGLGGRAQTLHENQHSKGGRRSIKTLQIIRSLLLLHRPD